MAGKPSGIASTSGVGVFIRHHQAVVSVRRRAPRELARSVELQDGGRRRVVPIGGPLGFPMSLVGVLHADVTVSTSINKVGSQGALVIEANLRFRSVATT